MPDSHAKPGSIRAAEIAAWIAAALAFRYAFMIVLGRVVDTADALHYIAAADAWTHAQFVSALQTVPPLYPVLCAGMRLAISNIETAARLVSLVASSLLVWPVIRLADSMHGRGSARVAALLMVLWPWLADYGSRIAPEALAVTLWFAGVYLLHRGIVNGGAWAIAAPLAFFALHLTRPEGLFILIAAPIGAALLLRRSNDRALARIGIFVIVAISLLAVHAAFNALATGSASVNPRVGGVSETAGYLFTRRAEAIVRTFFITLTEKFPIMLGPYLLVFAGAGIFMRDESARRNVPLEWLIAWFALVQWGLAILSSYPEPRYLMAPVVAIALWSARGIHLVGREAARWPERRWLRFLPAGGMVALMLLGAATTLLPQYMGHRPPEPREYKIVGEWMKANLEPALILTRKPQVGFYAGMPTTGPAADDSIEEAVVRARNVNARYVVVDERYTASLVPALESLLDPAAAPPSLELLEHFDPYPACRVVVYRVLPAP